MNTAFNFILWKFHLRSIFFRQYCTSGLNLCDDWQPLVVSVESVLDQSRWFFFFACQLTHLPDWGATQYCCFGRSDDTHTLTFVWWEGWLHQRSTLWRGLIWPPARPSLNTWTDRQTEPKSCVCGPHFVSLNSSSSCAVCEQIKLQTLSPSH